MENYNPQKIEKKWQKIWEESGIFQAENNSQKPKFYCLDMFPYPSGVGLHVGHPRGYVASDIISRYKKMKGFNVLHPMGWDAFGLPAENYALKTGIKPQISTEKNIGKFKEQIKSLGLSHDWSREINTTDSKYYKWTQWIFLQLYKKGLAYESKLPINWCPLCKTGLANEEVVQGECERCGTGVEKKNIRQWVLRITDYADRLLEDLEGLKWPKKIKEMQKNWIGKSEGADIIFKIKDKNNLEEDIKVYTTRPDTILGATFLTLSPEHPFLRSVQLNSKFKIQNSKLIEDYIKKAKLKPDFERTDLTKEKTGVNLEGVVALNPATDEEIPVYIADYVLSHYGYGAIMGVPAHDERDLEFAKKFNLPIKEVKLDKTVEEATKWLEEKGCAKKAINYKLRDWVFSRQRYWGEPIPLIHCVKCGIVPVPEEELPVKLPKVENYQPTGTGESPLAIIDEWVNTKCPKCFGFAKRETNTMPQWAGSCWYYLRYIDPSNSKELIDNKKEKYWMPVDLYIGGAEHAVLHLLYARFWHKFLYDIDKVSTKEPFQLLKNQGLIMAEGGQKMSKSKGNVVSPDDIINEYGADTLRLYEMFIGSFEEQVVWNKKGIIGVKRFLDKVWSIKVIKKEGKNDKLLHQTIKKVTEDIEKFKFNTAISTLMILINNWSKKEVAKDDFMTFLKILSLFAPHISEEMWFKLGNPKGKLTASYGAGKKSIFKEKWPEYNSKLIKEEKTILIIQINGKVRDKIEVEIDILEEKAKELVLSQGKVLKWIADKKIKKIIFIPGKLINIVV